MQNVPRNRHNTWPRVFVAMPFGKKHVKSGADAGTASPPAQAREDVSVDFDEIWALLIRPALQRARCRAYRADEEASAGDIRTDMFFELVTGEFVLADISTLNANVFYELGVRHGISPRGVLMVDGGWDRRPFDVAPDRTFSYQGALFEAGVNRDSKAWKGAVKQEVEKLAGRLQAAVATDASTTSSPVYKELSGLKPVDWGQIQNAKARYFGNQLQEWNARVRKAKRQSYVGDILTLSRDAPNRFIEWQLRLDAARALSDLGRFERARELLRAMVTENPTCPETRYALAKVLDRLAGLATRPEAGREYHGRAELEIQEALSHGGDAPQAHRLLGRIYKYRWRNRWQHEADESARRRLAAEHWETAKKGLSHYQEAQMRDLGCFHAGVNVISLCRLREHLGLQESAEADPAEVVGLVKTATRRTLMLAQRDTAVEKDESKVIWATVALGEVALLTAGLDDARTFFQRAVTHPEISLSQLKAFDEQLDMYEKLGFEKDCVAQLRNMVKAQLEAQNTLAGGELTVIPADSPPRVFVFRGESFDEPELEEEVRSRLGVLLQAQWKIREGDLVICSAQRGAEILFAEACVRLKANVRLLLPLSRAEFVSQSVCKTGADWEQRFYKLAEQCEVLQQPVRLGATPAELDPYERNNVWCLEVARTELGPDVKPRVIALSIRGEEHPDATNNAGGLRHFERCARNLDLLVERAVVWGAADEPTWFPTGNTVVHVRRPNGKTDTLSLEKELRLGRAGDNDVILGDRSISRHHLKLKSAAEGVVQLTNVSVHPNATFLDGVALAPCSEKNPLLVTPEQTIKLVDGTQITFEALNRPA
jgi:tetratricopeptide (TPR) repeat protein